MGQSSANGNTANGNTSNGNTANGNAANGNAANGNTANGNTANGNTANGNTANGNTATGNTASSKGSTATTIGLTDGGPEPMDDASDTYNSTRDASGAESGSDTCGGGSGGGSIGSGGAGGSGGCGGGGGVVALTLVAGGGIAKDRATREERAAKALQAAARVMLARKGRFQTLARETHSLLLIQKRSREWLKQKQGSSENGIVGNNGSDIPFSHDL